MSAPANTTLDTPSPDERVSENLRLQHEAMREMQEQMAAATQAVRAAIGTMAQVDLDDATTAVANPDAASAEAPRYTGAAAGAVARAVAAQREAIDAAHAEASRATAAAVAGMASPGRPAEHDEVERKPDPAAPTQDVG